MESVCFNNACILMALVCVLTALVFLKYILSKLFVQGIIFGDFVML